MTDTRPEPPPDGATERERYSHGYDPKMVEYLGRRNVRNEAAFLAPHLRPGMSLLDCGCGPGALTTDLAELVAPGRVVGIDIAPQQVTLAQEHAQSRGVSNVMFQAGNIYELPFPDRSFDVAFAHTVLQHLADPAKALREMYCVLKVGGLVGVREEDTGGMVFAPSNGGDPYLARRHRAVLHESGFGRVIGSASCECYGAPEATKWFGEVMARFMPSNLETGVRLGWVDAESVERMGAAWKAWGEHPDAFFAILRCEAIGWRV